MKKLFRMMLALTLIAVLSVAVSAAMFTDVDSYAKFEMTGEPVYAMDDDYAEYWTGAWSGAGDNGDEVVVEALDGVGYKGSKGISIYSEGTANVGLYLYATSENGIATDYSGANYLRLWMDCSNVEFRKANFGVVNSAYCLFSTDEVDGAWDCPFYYSRDGVEWEEIQHGGDGCFGDAQDSNVMGKKGWFAFPLKDFTIRENANWEAYDALTPCDPSDILALYLFWDYSDNEFDAQGNPFVLDDIEFVEDYKAFAETPVASDPTPAPVKPGEPTLLWDFDSDEAMSDVMGGNSSNGVMYYGEGDYYVFMATGSDPYVSVDTPADDVEDILWAKVRVHNPSPATAIELFGHTNGRGLTGSECTHFEIEPNCDEWRTYIIYIPDENVKTVNAYKDPQYAITEPYWEGTVEWIRLDPMWHEGDDGNDSGGSCESGDEIHIDYIAFFSNEADAQAFRSKQDAPTAFVSAAKPVEEAPAEEPAPVEEAPAPVEEAPVEEAPEETPAADEAPAEAPTETPTETTTETPAPAKKSGCGSFLGGGVIVLVTILGCGWITSKKH